MSGADRGKRIQLKKKVNEINEYIKAGCLSKKKKYLRPRILKKSDTAGVTVPFAF